jgi:hypothetical protein
VGRIPKERTVPVSTAQAPRLTTRALLGATIAATFALTACSAGQVTQTDVKVPAVPGTNDQVVNEAENIQILLRDMVIAFDGREGYAQGGDAPLVVRIFNGGQIADRLVCVETESATSVELVDDTATTPTEPASPSDEASPSDGATPSDSATPTGGPSPSDEPSPSESAVQSDCDDPANRTELNQEIPVDGRLPLVPGEGSYLQLTGLTEELMPGDVITVTFFFEVAGKSDPIDIPMGLPMEPEGRETAEFEDDGH